MNTSTARDLLSMHPTQAAYALALADFEASSIASEAAKVAAGIDYTNAITDADIDAMCDREGAIDAAHGIIAKRNALTKAELRLIAWGIEHACKLPSVSLNEAAELTSLRDAAAKRVVVRAKVVALCFRLAA